MAKLRILDHRRLVFPIETAVDAVLELDAQRGGSLARARIHEARIAAGAEADRGLVIVSAAPGVPGLAEQRFSLAAVAAAIINYCSQARIPVPRGGTRSIEIVPEGFALGIQLSIEVRRRHGPVPHASASVPAATGEGDSPAGAAG
jgi:hypothetical protein